MSSQAGTPSWGVALGFVAMALCGAVSALLPAPPPPPPPRLHMSLGGDDHRMIDRASLIAVAPTLAALPADAQDQVFGALVQARAPCEPCWDQQLSVNVCLIGAPPSCAQLPRLVRRVTRLAAAGAKPKALLLALSYGDAWVPAASDGPDAAPNVELWLDLSAPFAPEALQISADLAAHSLAPPTEIHLYATADRHGAEALAVGGRAALQMGSLTEYATAAAKLRASTRSAKGDNSNPDAEFARDVAQEAGLDLDRWKAVSRDQAAEDPSALGVRSSPTWFVGGYRMRGMQSRDAIGVMLARERADLER